MLSLCWCISDEDTGDYNVPELLGFTRGQIYNRSAASQIRVLPAPNTSQIDVC